MTNKRLSYVTRMHISGITCITIEEKVVYFNEKDKEERKADLSKSIERDKST